MRYVVTGGAGHVGSAVVASLLAREDTEGVVVADLRPARALSDRVESEILDVRDVHRLTGVLERTRADAVLHLACSHDAANGRQAMYETNVVGTNALLAAAVWAGTPHLLTISSAACYAAGADAEPLGEAAAFRTELESDLARDRSTVDRLCQLWAARQPERTMTIVRPCAVLTSAPEDAVARLFTAPPHCAASGDPRAAVQFLHEDDFVAALVLLATGGHGGIFNVAGGGTVELGDCVRLIGLKSSRGPLKKLRRGKGARELFEELELLVGTPPIATERLRQVGWTPHHASRAAFEAAMGTRGKLVEPARTPAAPVVPDVVGEPS